MTVGDGHTLRTEIGMGLVTEVFDAARLATLPGLVGIGHVRYPTAGGDLLTHAQPLLGVSRSAERFSLAHNGNLLRIDRGPLVRGDTDYREATGRARRGVVDTQALVELIRGQDGPLIQVLRRVLPRVHGAYCLVLTTRSRLYAARDPHGFRPLCLGRLPTGGWMVASETAALDTVDADFIRDVEPGELLMIDQDGPHSERFAIAPHATCVFEHVYIARPDSLITGRRVLQVRQSFGAALAREAPVRADAVIPVPDTARPAALGYAQESGLAYAEGLVRNHYLGRTFLRPTAAQRQDGVRLKLNPVPEVVRGRRIIVVDDSLVRGTSMRRAVAMLRSAGAAEIHLRVASAKIGWPCFFGVDISSQKELAAHAMSTEQIAAYVGVDSLAFLSVEAMRAAVGSERSLCVACFTGCYPASVPLTGTAPRASIGDDPGDGACRCAPGDDRRSEQHHRLAVEQPDRG